MTDPFAIARLLSDNPDDPVEVRDCLREVIASAEQAMRERDALREALTDLVAKAKTCLVFDDADAFERYTKALYAAAAALSPPAPAVVAEPLADKETP